MGQARFPDAGVADDLDQPLLAPRRPLQIGEQRGDLGLAPDELEQAARRAHLPAVERQRLVQQLEHLDRGQAAQLQRAERGALHVARREAERLRGHAHLIGSGELLDVLRDLRDLADRVVAGRQVVRSAAQEHLAGVDRERGASPRPPCCGARPPASRGPPDRRAARDLPARAARRTAPGCGRRRPGSRCPGGGAPLPASRAAPAPSGSPRPRDRARRAARSGRRCRRRDGHVLALLDERRGQRAAGGAAAQRPMIGVVAARAAQLGVRGDPARLERTSCPIVARGPTGGRRGVQVERGRSFRDAGTPARGPRRRGIDRQLADEPVAAALLGPDPALQSPVVPDRPADLLQRARHRRVTDLDLGAPQWPRSSSSLGMTRSRCSTRYRSMRSGLGSRGTGIPARRTSRSASSSSTSAKR